MTVRDQDDGRHIELDLGDPDRLLHELVADSLRERIRDGEFTSGLLPSIAVLIAQYGVSKPTIQKALDTLRDDGLVVGRVGRGTYLRRQP
jgi:GntR family transcriptional regulator